MWKAEQLTQLEQEVSTLSHLQEVAMGLFLYDGGNYSLTMESQAASEAARISAAYSSMLREKHPPKVKSFETARARLADLLTGDNNRDISPAIVVIDCTDKAQLENTKQPWIVQVVGKVIDDFATLYGIKTPKINNPLDETESRVVLARMKQKENIQFQTVIFTNVDSLSTDQQLALCHTFLGQLADTRSLNAFLVHEKEITHMSPGKLGAQPLSESRWHLKDLSGSKKDTPEWLTAEDL